MAHEYHVDLAALWQSRRWRKLLNLIDGLPRTSWLRQNLSQDDEIAQWQLEARETTGKPTVFLTEWSLESELLSVLVDLLGEHLALTAAINSKDHKMNHPKPMPRPERAIDRAMERNTNVMFDELVAEIERAQEGDSGGL